MTAKWLNRNEFEDLINRSVMSATIADNDIFALGGIDIQLKSFEDMGIILLRTKPWASAPLEEFAALKVGGTTWKFSADAEIVEDIKYGRIARFR